MDTGTVITTDAKKIKLDSKERLELGQVLGKQFADTWTASRGLREKVVIWRNQYEGILPDKPAKAKWSSNVNIPTTKAHINSASVSIANTALGSDPIFEISATEPEALEYEQKQESYLQFWCERTRLRSKGGMAIKEALQTGQCWLRSGIKHTGKPTPRLIDVFNSGKPVSISKLDVLPTCDYVITEDMMLLPYTAPSFAQANGAFVRVTLRWNDIVKAGDNLYSESTDFLKTQWQTDNSVSQTHEQQGIENVTPIGLWNASFECWEGIYRYTPLGEDSEREWFVLAYWDSETQGDAVILKCIDFRDTFGEKALWPFFPIIYSPKPNSMWGGSMCEDIRGMQEWLNSVFNACTDGFQMSIMPPMAVSSAIYNNKNLRWGPFEKWPVNNPTDITPIPTPPATFAAIGSAMGLMEIVRNTTERVTTVSDTNMGKPSQGTHTKFEIATVVELGNEQVNYHVGTIQMGIDENTGLEAFGENFLQLIWKFMPPAPINFKSNTGGKEPFEITNPAWNKGTYEITAHGTYASSSPEVRFKRSMGLKQTIAQSPFLAISPLDTRESLLDKVKRWYRAESKFIQAMGEKDPEGWLGSEPSTFEEALSVATILNPMAVQAIVMRLQSEGQVVPPGMVPDQGQETPGVVGGGGENRPEGGGNGIPGTPQPAGMVAA